MYTTSKISDSNKQSNSLRLDRLYNNPNLCQQTIYLYIGLKIKSTLIYQMI